MGASKKEQFSEKQIDASLLGRAIAAPARIAILQHLNYNNFVSSSELSKEFHLSITAIHQHIKILKEAKLVNETYQENKHGYFINFSSQKSLEKIKWIFNIHYSS
jgi:predicted transcriptional regulator